MNGFRIIAIFCSLVISLGNVHSADEVETLQSDAEIRQKLVGVWIVDIGTNSQIYSAKGTIAYASNSCYVAKAVVSEGNSSHEETYEGMWEVKQGILTATITNAIGIKGQPGKWFDHAKVVRIDERELILKSGTNQSGHIDMYKRKQVASKVGS